jgi:uncharacterized protein YegP (UPF0339 family)
VIRVPSAAAVATLRRGRRPAYISASTASVQLSLNGSSVGVINTAPQSPQCAPAAGSTGGMTCSATFAVNAATYSYTLSAFDQLNGAGTKLSTAIGQFVVVQNQANVLHAVLNGFVHALSVNLSSYTVQQGVSANVQVNVAAYDPDNNVIISGSYADAQGNPVSITLANSDTSGAMQLSQTTLPGVVSPVMLTYSGAKIASQTITATAPNVAGGGATLTVVTPSTQSVGSVGSLVLASAPAPGSSSTWQLSASVVGTDGNPMTGVPVSFGATGGTVALSLVNSDAAGSASTTVSQSSGTAVAAVTATAGSQSATINIVFATTTTMMHRRGVRDITAPRLILGFTHGGGNTALSNPFSSPDPCHVPTSTTPSVACQPLFDQQKLTQAAINGVQAGCKKFNTISDAIGIAECAGMTGTIAACVFSETGVGAVICAGAVDSGIGAVISKDCLSFLGGKIAGLVNASFVYDSIQFVIDPSVTGLIAVGCDVPLDSLKPVITQISFTLTSQRAFSTDVAGFAAPLTATGAGFSGFKSITLTRSGPSTAGPYVWNKSDGTLDAAVTSYTDTSLALAPIVTRMGDARGITTWTLTAIDGNNVSYTVTFTVDYEPTATTAPDIPTPTSPGTASGPGPTQPSNSIVLSWSAAARATSYSFGVRDMITNTLVVDKSTTGTTYTSNLAPSGRYRWNVQACNSAGCSQFTPDLYFQTPAATLPAVPTSTSPGDTTGPGPGQAGNTITLAWNAVEGATYYSFGVRDMSSGALVVDKTTTSSTYTAALSAGTQYRWNVQACNGVGCSAFTAPLYFQTPAGTSIPATPANTSPGTTGAPGPTQSASTVTVSWGASTGATYYSLGVRDMNSGALVVNTTTSSTSYSAALASNGQFRWNVAACSSGGCSSFTTDLYFQTPNAGVARPATPTGTSPGTTSGPGTTQSSSTVTVSWNASSGATSYSIGVRDMTTNALVVNTTTTATSYTAALTSSGQFRWNVAACNSAGCSAFTTDLYFQTPSSVTIPGSPTNTSPGTTTGPGPTQSSSTVGMSWSASSGATYYSLGVRDLTSNVLVVDTTTSSTSYSAGLTSGRQYRWNVAACNSAGCSSFTTDLYFQTPSSITIPAMPTGTSPGTTSGPGPTQSGSTVSVSWSASSGATYYSLGVRNMSTNVLVINTTTTSTSYSASLTSGGQFRWNVAACNTAGCSSFTTDLYFQTPSVVTIPGTPTGTSPGNTSSPGPTQSGSTVALSWGAVSGATSYSLGVRDMTSNVLVVDTTTSGSSYTASLSGKGKFRWNVAACNSAGCSTFTTPLYFQTP